MNQLILGDCIESLKKLPADSVDLICTDPPYGIGFMGKAWDTFTPDYQKQAAAREAKRRPRGDGRSVTGFQDAAYAGTYDYSLNGRRAFQDFMHAVSKECLRVLKPGAFMFATMTPRQDCLSRVYLAMEDAGFRMDVTSMYWTFASGFPKAANIGKMVDKREGVEFPKNVPISGNTSMSGGNYTRHTAPPRTTDAAKTLDGSYGGFQPKPAVEVIIVAMKPLSEKTFVDQALANEKGITWLDDCRIPIHDNTGVWGTSNNTNGPKL